MEKIKLVIWDLDETFWSGVLSEGGITEVKNNIDHVINLTNKGIINSISSKNNFEDARAQLKLLKIWDYFVFPSIDWVPKGPSVKEIIKKSQLRDFNILFIDDNNSNLKEVKYYNPNINCIHASEIDAIMSHKSLRGKKDLNNTRLKQYKILEKKSIASRVFQNNEDFLRSSNIKIYYIDDPEKHKDRLYDLLSRTNQLNFTKKRLNLDQINKLLIDKELESKLIHVTDNYGDYGICGFYTINKRKNILIHFLFSCRILNLGVAQYVFSKLNFPRIRIVPEVAEELDGLIPDWITETEKLQNSDVKEEKSGIKFNILFKGGCDLDQMLRYIDKRKFKIVQETNYVSKNGLPIHQDHTSSILLSKNISEERKNYLIENVFFIDDKYFSTSIFNNNHHYIIYSVLMDYTQQVYKHKTKDLEIAFGGKYYDLTNLNDHKHLISLYEKKGIEAVTSRSLEYFYDNFINKGRLSPKDFLSNLKKFRSNINVSIPIIFINGAEVDYYHEKEKSVSDHHKVMNSVLDNFILNSDNTFLLDVRNTVKQKSQCVGSIRHYNREAYRDLSKELSKVLKDISKDRLNINLNKKALFIDFLQRYPRLYKKVKFLYNKLYYVLRIF